MHVFHRKTGVPVQFVSSLWQVYNDRIVFALGLIVFGQLLPQTSGLNSNCRVLARIVGRGFAKGIDANSVFLQLVGFTGKGLVRQELQ